MPEYTLIFDMGGAVRRETEITKRFPDINAARKFAISKVESTKKPRKNDETIVYIYKKGVDSIFSSICYDSKSGRYYQTSVDTMIGDVDPIVSPATGRLTHLGRKATGYNTGRIVRRTRPWQATTGSP